jgi:hypothetical protein
MNAENSYNGNINVKRDGVIQNFSSEEVKEYMKCLQSAEYFIENYCKIISLNDGLVKFKLYDYQKKMVKSFSDNRFSIALTARQAGKSQTACAWILWYVLFHSEKTFGILANKGAIAREMLGRITLMLENLPFFLQPGCKVLNKGSLHFSNNSRIIAAATSSSSVRGMSFSGILLDEFAFVKNAVEFYESTYPTIASGTDTKVIITSTPKGIGNLFHRLWMGAVQKTNEYVPIRVTWRDVPGRDDTWRDQTIANTSLSQFRQEHEAEFLGASNTLIDSNALIVLVKEDPIEVRQDIKYYKSPVAGHNYIMTVDVSKGRGQDYSTFTIFDTSSTNFEQVAVYRCNMISPLVFPDIIVRNAKLYNDAWVLIENNDVGHVVCKIVYYEYEYENTFVESSVKAMGIGVSMTKTVKRIGCSNLKDLIESTRLIIYDENTITELCAFESKGESFEASGNMNDDLVMNLVMFAWFVSTPVFSEISSVNFRDMMYADRLKELEDDMVPFGYINTATEDTPSMIIYQEMIDAQREWNML